MKRMMVLTLLVAAALLMVSGTVLAATKVGTRGNDRLVGTNKNDVLKGKGGNDRLVGKGGNDRLKGGGGRDRLYDKANPLDRDRFSCGSGRDIAYANPNDVVSSTCEVKRITREGPPPGSRDLLPDLGMKVPGNLQIQNTGSQRLLRFSTTVVNVGDGSFELHGRRDAAAQEMDVTQRIFRSSGGYRDRSTTATMFYAGDGHNHWHVKDVEEYELMRNGTEVASGAKQGFCFFDNVRHGATSEAVYPRGCANGLPNVLSVKVGISRGWGDLYFWNVVGQYVDVTNVPDGPYRLRITADKPNWFSEKDESNNVTWADIEISGDTVRVLGYGPSSPPIR